MFDNILIATDNSRLIKNAMKYTANVFSDSNYHVLNVINVEEKSVPKTEIVIEDLKKAANRAIEDASEILQKIGIKKIKKVIREGVPSEEILRYTYENHIDLLVMGTQSKSGTQTLEIGNTCLNTLENISIPTLLFDAMVDIKRPKKIFNPSTGSKYSMEASYLAVELAEYLEGEITLMCIKGGTENESTFRRVLTFAEKNDVPMDITQCAVRPDKDIVEKSKKYDFIVVSRGRPGIKYKLRKLFRKFALGSLEREIIVETKKPMLFVGD